MTIGRWDTDEPGAVLVLDAEGRLAVGEGRVAELNARAGGGSGLPLALPGLRAVVDGSRRLGVGLTGRVLIAEADHDIELDVSAAPDAAGWRLAMTGWWPRRTVSPRPATDREREWAAGNGTAATVLPTFAGSVKATLEGPLAALIADADAIADDASLAPVYLSYGRNIAAAARHMTGMVDDLPRLAAVEQPDMAVAVEPLDLAELARRAGGLLRVSAEAAGVGLSLPPPETRVTAIGDAGHAMQIVLNLVGNAVHYSDGGAAVTLVAVTRDGTARVIVGDDGPGIAPDDQAKIFDKFQRLERSEGEPEGSGLGLYIARRLARRMGGDVTVESVPGQGSRFTLSLPAQGAGI